MSGPALCNSFLPEAIPLHIGDRQQLRVHVADDDPGAERGQRADDDDRHEIARDLVGQLMKGGRDNIGDVEGGRFISQLEGLSLPFFAVKLERCVSCDYFLKNFN